MVADLERETKVRRLLDERFADWQSRGYIPSRRIEPGSSNNRPRRARGWTHWHHLFNPRQLLVGGLIAKAAEELDFNEAQRAGLLLSTTRVADWNSRMCRWNGTVSKESGVNTFDRPGLGSPVLNYSCLPSSVLHSHVCIDLGTSPIIGEHTISLSDAREVDFTPDIWITDPGYADQVDYEESSEFFLGWLDRRLTTLFPGWYSDSKRALAVCGKGESFRVALAECYKRLAAQMPDNGFQVVMFTHSDPDVWSDVALVLWAAGLQVTAAWTIATETGTTGIKIGNYVQGTVILVLRKRQGTLRGDMSDLYPDIQAEVNQQLESMLALDPKDDPNFADADYQLAAYAAALRVLTST